MPNLFNYIDARDLDQAVKLCTEKDGLVYEVFNESNDNNSVGLNNGQILKRFYPSYMIKFEIGLTECLFSKGKLRQKLNYKPQHNWMALIFIKICYSTNGSSGEGGPRE